MKMKEAEKEANKLLNMAENDGDACLTVYFSKSSDKYRGMMANMDTGDALIIIEELIEKFHIDRDVLKNMLSINS